MLSRVSVAFLAIALAVLAGLQYHWIGQVTDAERLRLQRTVRNVADDFADDFRAELRLLLGSLELRPGGPMEPARLAFRYHTWVASAMYPKLLRSLHYASPEGLYRLDFDLGTMEPAAWSRPFESVSEFLQFQTDSQGRRAPRTPPRIEDVDAFLIPLGRLPDLSRGNRGERTSRGNAANARTMPDAWVVVELDRDVIVKEIFSGIATRQFDEVDAQNFRLAVVTGSESRPQALFTTGDAWSTDDLNSPDYAVSLLGAGGGFQRGRGSGTRREVRDNERDLLDLDRETLREPRYGIGGPLVSPAGLQDWRVLIKHEAGSLGDATNRFRRRNLAISFGVLVVLGFGAATVVLSGQRAKKLGRLQMEFAAGVSHELRTPLSVIQSAAHNLGTGVVKDRQGIEEYAAIVQKEARRLSEMVEQIMTYTETQSGRKRYDVGPVDVRDVVEQAVSNTVTAQETSAEVSVYLDASLPMVLADAPTLIRCVQNLLSNAVKYGGVDGAVRIEIEGRHDPAAKTVEICVSDRGPGVPPEDVPHLFQAFQRGTNVTTTTPGNGLGLHLVQKMMEAQKGSVRYEPIPEGGSRFILTLPASDISYDTA